MPLLSDAELAEFQALSEESMPETGQRAVPVTSQTGGDVTTVYQVSGTAVRCRIAPLRMREGLIDAQVQATGDWMLVLPAGTETFAKDRWAVTSPAGWTKTLEVVGPLGPRTYEMDRRLICVERQGVA